jgi:uncharacterized delta-60 repeat protein
LSVTLRYKAPSVLFLALMAAVAIAAVAAADRIDSSFGSGGLAAEPPPAEALGRNVGVRDLAVMPGGGMAAAVSGIEGSRYFAAARLSADGALDAGFGNGGYTERLRIRRRGFAWEGLRTQAQHLALQSDGKVVVAGYAINEVGGTAPLLVRFRPDGAPDPSFGRRGVVVSKPGPEKPNPLDPYRGGGILRDVAIQRPGGRIVAVGSLNENGGPDPAGLVTAYRPSGQVDPSFGRHGRVVVHARGHALYTAFTDVEVLRNRKILVAGYMKGRVLLMRPTATGRVDHGFGGGDGKVFLGRTNRVLCCGPALVAVQPDGRILLAGEGLHSGGATILLARLRPSGKLDRSFGKRGVAPQRAPRAGYFTPLDLVLQGRRTVVAGVQSRADEQGREFSVFTVLAYAASGRLDRSFGPEGVQLFPYKGGSTADAAAVQADGHLVVGGGVEGRNEMPPEPALLLTRYAG